MFQSRKVAMIKIIASLLCIVEALQLIRLLENTHFRGKERHFKGVRSTFVIFWSEVWWKASERIWVAVGWFPIIVAGWLQSLRAVCSVCFRLLTIWSWFPWQSLEALSRVSRFSGHGGSFARPRGQTFPGANYKRLRKASLSTCICSGRTRGCGVWPRSSPHVHFHASVQTACSVESEPT